MTTYLGIDLLLIRPNAPPSWGSELSRPVRRADNDQGNVLTATTAAPPSTTHDLEWVCRTRAELIALRAVLDARCGRLVPIWIPTYQRDIELLGVGFFDWQVPTARGGAAMGALINAYPHWRHWFQSSPGGALYCVRRMTSSTDNGDGTTTWVGANQFGTDIPFLLSSDGRMFSRLRLCRMATDTYREQYLARASRVTASFIEVPAEAP